MSDSASPEFRRGVDRPAVLLAVGLCVVAAVTYSSLRLGYAYGFVPLAAYGPLSDAVVWGSVLVGVSVAGVSGFVGQRALAGVLSGVAPAVGISLGSLLSVAVGVGHYDARPLVLLGVVVLGCTAVAAVAWLVGNTLRRAR